MKELFPELLILAHPFFHPLDSVILLLFVGVLVPVGKPSSDSVVNLINDILIGQKSAIPREITHSRQYLLWFLSISILHDVGEP